MAIRFLSAESVDGNATFTGGVTAATSYFSEMVRIDISDISTGENRGLQLLNSNGTDQQWNVTAGQTGVDNDKFTIRDATYNIDALTLAINSGNATFAGNVTLAATKHLQYADDKIIIGNTNSTLGSEAISIGYDADSTGNQSIGIGYNPAATGTYSVAMGYNVTASGTSTFVFGTSGSHSDDNTLVASGLDLKVTGTGTSTFAGPVTLSGSGSAGRITGGQGIFGSAFCLTSNGYATFGSTSSSIPIALSIDGDGTNPALLIATDDHATFYGDVTVNGTITLGTASFVGTVAGATVVSSEGAYASSGSVKLYEAKRSGGAVAGDWSYDDATTDMSLGTSTNHSFALKTNNTRALTIDNSGNVGIGTTSPSSKIDVREDANNVYTGYFYNSSTAANAHGINVQTATTNAGAYAFRVNSASNANALVVMGNARVGIGTSTPDMPLDVAGNIRSRVASNVAGGFYIGEGHTAEAFGLLSQGANGYFKIRDEYNSADRFYIENDGKVGIGTSSPTYNLVVSNGGAGGIEFAINTATALNEMLVYNRSTSVFEKLRSQASQFEWYTDATANALVIQSGGNVGIGTTSPSSYNAAANHLVIAGTGNTGLTIASGTSNDGNIGFADGTSGADAYRGILRYNHATNSMQFFTNATERMRIDSSGNLLVSKTSANNGTVGNQFMTDGSANATVNGDTVARLNRLTSDGEIIRFQKDTATVGTIGTQNWGIGTSSPTQAKLCIDGAQNSIYLTRGGASDTKWTIQSDSASMYFQEAVGSYVLTLKENQHVGIGTTQPATKLHLGGTAPGDSIIRQDSTTSGTNWEIGERVAGKWQIFEDDGNTIVTTFMSTGNVGIGTESPTQKLHVVGKGLFTDDIQLTQTSPRIDYGNTTAGALRFFSVDANSEKMRLTSGGNLGIGDTNPTKILSVNNGIKVGNNGTEAGASQIYGDIQRPDALHFTKRNYTLLAGSSGGTYFLARQWHDNINWGAGNINVIIWGVYYGKNQYNKSDFSCRYGYSSSDNDVIANFNPGSMAVPYWTSATTVSGNIEYRDLKIDIPAYQRYSFEIINPGAMTQTYDINNTNHNRCYFYPH